MIKEFKHHVFVVQPGLANASQHYWVFESVHLEVGDSVFIRINDRSSVYELVLDKNSDLHFKRMDTWTQTYFPLEWHQERYSGENFFSLYETLSCKNSIPAKVLNWIATRF